MLSRVLHTVVFLLAAFSANAQSTVLEPFVITFEATNGQYTLGEVTMSLDQQGKHWSLQSHTKPGALFSLLSRGEIKEASVVRIGLPSDDPGPVVFTQKYSFWQERGTPERNLHAQFGEDGRRVEFNNDAGETTVLEEPTPIYDPLSSLVQMMISLKDDESAQTTLPIFSRGNVKHSTFTVLGTEVLTIADNAYHTVKIVRDHGGGKRKTYIWFAKDAGNAPLKFEQIKRGELTMRLEATSIAQAAARTEG